MVKKILVIKSEKKPLVRSENEKKTTSKFSKILEKCNNSNKYKLSIHKTNGFWYASTQSYTIDPKTGKKKYTHTHWGTLTHELEFYPNEIYWFADQSVKDKLIYPPEWDLKPVYDLAKRFSLVPVCKVACSQNIKHKKVKEVVV